MAKVVQLARSVLYAPHSMDPRTGDAEDLGAGAEHSSSSFGLLVSAGGSEKPPLPLSLRQRETIRQIAQTTQRQLVQMGTLHRQSAILFAETLAAGEEWVQQAAPLRPLTPDEQWLLGQEQRIFLESLLTLLAQQVNTGARYELHNAALVMDEQSYHHDFAPIAETYLRRISTLLFREEANDGKEGTESVGLSAPQPECQWGGHLRGRRQCGRATESGATADCDGSAKACGGHATAAAKS